MFGLDYVTGPPIAALKSANVAFVCRYLSEENPVTLVKILTASEAKALSAAGISLVSNYEWTGTTPLGGHNAGVFDAQIARDQHAACGGPADRPIYFSVDFDATPAQMPAIIDYFHGVASVIGLARTGAYGSYFTIKALLDAKAIMWAWQTYAWSGGQWDSRAHIQQYDNGVTFAGLSVDYDRSMTKDFGQWFYGGIMVPTGWKDDGKTLTAPNGNTVVLGFRDHILSKPGGWDPGDQPLSEEFHADPLEYSNPSLGAGQKLCCTKTTLEYTTARGVFEAWQGQEIQALLALLAKAQQAPASTIDTTALIAAINAIPDAIAPAVTQALVEAKKL